MALDQTRSLHHACEGPLHRYLDGAALVATDRDPLDHAPHHLADLRRVGVGRLADQAFDPLGRGLNHRIDVSRDLGRGRGLGCVDRVQLPPHRVGFGLERGQPRQQRGVMTGVRDRVDDPGHLILFALHGRNQLGSRLVRRTQSRFPIGDHLGTQPRHRLLVHPAMANGIADEPLEISAPDLQVVATRALRTEGAAAVVADVPHGVRRAAGAADQQPGQQVLRAMGPVEGHAVVVWDWD